MPAIYISEVCAANIHNFVFKDSKYLSDIKGENQAEIGGWLLGKTCLDDNGKFVVSFERFVEVTRPQDQSETRIAFGASAWSTLDRQLEIYKPKKFELVGWFHTHPGWGVFLSGEDINTHMTYFKHPYQIAMEMESVNSDFDLGLFTWKDVNLEKVTGEGLNNKADLKSEWYKWTDFRQWLS